MKKAILACLCFLLLPSLASAGILFGDRVTIYNGGGPAGGFTTTYGYSDSFPMRRTYRVYRQRAVVGYAVPAPAPVQAYVVPVQTYVVPQAPAAAPADPATVQQAPVVQTYSAPIYGSPVYAVDDVDDAEVVRVRHKEKHRHGTHKTSHKETLR